MNIRILVAIAVAAVVAVAAVAFVAMDDDNDSSKPDLTIGDVDGIRLIVYGNANNDDTIDSDDRAIIQSIVDGETVWNSSKAPYADANADGTVDSKDLDLVDAIINRAEGTYVYYSNYQGHATKVAYPTPTDNIGTMYYQAAQISVLFGIWDNVKACGVTSLNDIANPGYESKISYGSGYNVDPQTVVSSGVSTIICYTQTDTTAADMVNLVETTGYGLNVLCVNHEHLLQCVCTYGFLFGLTDISDRYLKLADRCSESIQTSMSDTASQNPPTVTGVMLYSTATTDKIRVLGWNPAGNTHNLAKLIHSVPNVNWLRADTDESPAYGKYVKAEWFLRENPGYILVVGSGLTSSTMTAEECQEIYHAKCKEVFGETDAYKNNHIICTSNGMLNTYSNPLVSLRILSYVYSEIDSSLANEAYSAWYTFTLHKEGNLATEGIYVIGSAMDS